MTVTKEMKELISKRLKQKFSEDYNKKIRELLLAQADEIEAMQKEEKELDALRQKVDKRFDAFVKKNDIIRDLTGYSKSRLFEALKTVKENPDKSLLISNNSVVFFEEFNDTLRNLIVEAQTLNNSNYKGFKEFLDSI